MRHRLLALAVTVLVSAVPAAAAFAQTAAPSRRPDVIYVPTPEPVVEAMLQVASVGKNDVSVQEVVAREAVLLHNEA